MSTTVVEDLAAWLTQIWDEEERIADEADGDDYYLDDGAATGRYLERFTPASVLARIAADRKILAWCTERDRIYVGTLASDPSDPVNYVPGSLAHPTDSVVLRLLAQAYRDRPGFRGEWAVGQHGKAEDDQP